VRSGQDGGRASGLVILRSGTDVAIRVELRSLRTDAVVERMPDRLAVAAQARAAGGARAVKPPQ
jgi:hypothetical protein